VSKALLEESSPNPQYQRWIDSYGGGEFGVLVEAVLDLTDEVCEGFNPAQKAGVTEAFVNPALRVDVLGCGPVARRMVRLERVSLPVFQLFLA
jgi:hypothetical protein